MDFRPPFHNYPPYNNNYHWNDIMEMISNDPPPQPPPPPPPQPAVVQNNFFNDQILEYLRYDGAGTRTNSYPQPTNNVLPQPPGPLNGFLDDNDDDVIDLTLDDDVPIMPSNTTAPVIDLAETPPLIDERDISNTPRPIPDQSISQKAIKVEQGATELIRAQPKSDPQENCSAVSSNTADPGSSLTLTLFCPVCLDPFEMIKAEGRQLLSTKCGHVFCGECINDVMRKLKHCPTCRAPIKKKLSLRAIFL